ncbi:hypothetical protein GY45DRAFT_297720 [Cubamyces sp. BRFM 1775]|nr:hypothetical protein GY45DRAFT_297720 [Cubamyces sp. BRFM 1775]
MPHSTPYMLSFMMHSASRGQTYAHLQSRASSARQCVMHHVSYIKGRSLPQQDRPARPHVPRASRGFRPWMDAGAGAARSLRSSRPYVRRHEGRSDGQRRTRLKRRRRAICLSELRLRHVRRVGASFAFMFVHTPSHCCSYAVHVSLVYVHSSVRGAWISYIAAWLGHIALIYGSYRVHRPLSRPRAAQGRSSLLASFRSPTRPTLLPPRLASRLSSTLERSASYIPPTSYPSSFSARRSLLSASYTAFDRSASQSFEAQGNAVGLRPHTRLARSHT